MKVLLSAYACAPGRGSEPEVGWNWMQQWARTNDVWVITRANNRARIEEGLRAHPAPRATFIYLDLPKQLRFWKNLPGGLQVYYYFWQFFAYRKARKLHRDVGFNLVHHVTFCTYWLPSFMALIGVPFIWGPVGGGESTPKSFRPALGLRGRLYEFFRDLAQSIGEMDPSVRITARRASLALATTEETAERLVRMGAKQVHVLPQIGISREQLEHIAPAQQRWEGRLRLLSAGNLLHLKGFHLALRAIAQVRDTVPLPEYTIFGKGPEREALVQLAKELGVSDRVRFLDPIPREQLMREMAGFDAMIHPSLHDSGAFVCLEAMTAGCVVICLDLGGPALQVTNETGIKVPAVSPDQAVNDLAAAIERLAGDAELRKRMACAARKRVENNFLWDKKLDCLREIYEG